MFCAGISLDVPGETEYGRPPIITHLWVQSVSCNGLVLILTAPLLPTKVLSGITAAMPLNIEP